MKKQLQLIIFAIFLTSLTGYGQQVSVDDEFSAPNDIKYKITALGSSNTVMIVDYLGTATSVNIPENVSYEGIHFEVTRIGNTAFLFNQLTSVTLPNSVTSIGNRAFQSNQFTSIEIPNSVTSIGNRAFWNNFQLTSVRLRTETPPVLGNDAFINPGNIHVVVPKGNSPGSTKTDYETAWNHYNFKSITEVVAVGDNLIAEDITYEITALGSPNTVMIVDYTGTATAVNIPDIVPHGPIDFDVTVIGEEAFQGNQLTDVEIPNSVTGIGNNAFQDNPLTSVRLGTGMPPDLGTDAFTNPGNIHVIVPVGALDNYVPAWNDLNFLSITEGVFVGETFTDNGITYQVTALGSTNTVTITDNTNTGSLTIPDTVFHGPNDFEVTSIGEEAFTDDQLTSVTIPNSVTNIGSGAFRRNQLNSVAIGENVTSIGAQAFRDNTLTGVTLPNSVTNIGNEAFFNNQLTSVTISNTVTHIGIAAFYNNRLTSVTIPNSVTNIADGAFLNNQLTSVTIGENVANIGQWAFRNNPDLNLVTVEANDPPTLYANAFQDPGRNQIDLVVPVAVGALEAYKEPVNGWTDFRSITLGIFTDNDIKYGITSPAEVEIFDYTGSATGVTIPSTAMDNSSNTTYAVTAIGEEAFLDNDLASITLPNSVTSIGHSAFSINPVTQVIAKGSTPPGLGDNVFTNRNQIDMIVPKGVSAGSIKTAYETAWGTGFNSITEGIQVSIDAPAETANLFAFPVTFQFDLDVTGFTQEDINVVNATVVDGSFSQVNGSMYTVEITPEPGFCEGTITIGVSENVAEYAPNFPNLAASATVTVNAILSVPSVNSTSVEYCVGQTADALTATGDNLLWYTAPTGGSGDANAPIPATTTAGTTSYYVSQTTNGCESERAVIEVTVNASPSAPSVNSTSMEYCVGQTADALTATGDNLLWYTAPTGGSGDANAPIPATTTAGTTSYYVSQTTNGCESERAVIEVTVNAIPSAPSVNSTSMEYCVGQTADPLTATGTNLVWYTAPTGGSGTTEAPTPATTTVGTTSYYVSQTTNGCESERAVIVVTVYAIPSAPSVNNTSVEYCVGQTADPLTATGTNLVWYTAPTGGSGDANAPIPATTTVGTTSYYVSQTTNGCESERAVIVVTVNASPEAPTISSTNTPVCAGEDAVFTIEGTEGDVVTYSGALNGTVTIPAGGTVEVTVNGVNSDATINLTEVTNGNCSVSLTGTATVMVNALPMTPSVSTNSPVCPGEGAIFTITGTVGDVVTYNDGASTATATLGTDGTATVTVNGVSSDVTINLTEVTNGNCSVSLTGTATVMVNALPMTPSVSTNSPVCPGEDAMFTITGTVGDVVTYNDGASTATATLGTDGTATVTVNGVSSDVTLNLTGITNGSCSVSLTETATVTVLNSALGGNGCDIIANDALRVLVMTPSCIGSADGSVAVIMDTSGYRMDISIQGDTMENRFEDIASGTNFEIDGLAVGDYTVTVTIPEISFERTFGATINGIGPVSGKRESLDLKEGKATYVVSGSERYEVSVNGGKMDFAFADTGPQSIQLENLYGHTEVVISGRNGCQGKVTDSFIVDSVLAEVYPTVTSSFITILTQGDHLDVQVHTLSGRLVKGARFTERENIMDLSFLESGMYILKMASKGKEQTIKIIKR